MKLNKVIKGLIKRFCILLLCFVLFFITSFGGFIIYHYFTDKDLIVTNYYLDTSLKQSIRIVQLSDLHNEQFGCNNDELINLIKEQNPDLIVMTGDMINENDSNTDIITTLVEALVKIAPVYYSYGNHEIQWDYNYKNINSKTIGDIISEAGGVVLEKNYQDISIYDEIIRIGGYAGYYRNPIMASDDPNVWKEEEKFFDDFENTNNYKILLNHIPTVWLDWGSINKSNIEDNEKNYYESNGIDIDGYDVDLVLTGHYHGGQWNLPIIGGVYAPNVGFNPIYTKGIFIGNKATCILSAGLGNEYKNIPRINNPGEIVVIDLENKE